MPTREEYKEYRAKRIQVQLTNPHAKFLPLKQLEIVKHFCNRNNPLTFANKKESMLAAGYKMVTTASQKRVFESPVFKLVLDMYMQQEGHGSEVQRDAVIGMFKEQYALSNQECDRSNAIRCAENFARLGGHFNDKLNINSEQQQEIDGLMRHETEQIAKLRVAAILDDGVVVEENTTKALPPASDNTASDILKEI